MNRRGRAWMWRRNRLRGRCMSPAAPCPSALEHQPVEPVHASLPDRRVWPAAIGARMQVGLHRGAYTGVLGLYELGELEQLVEVRVARVAGLRVEREPVETHHRAVNTIRNDNVHLQLTLVKIEHDIGKQPVVAGVGLAVGLTVQTRSVRSHGCMLE